VNRSEHYLEAAFVLLRPSSGFVAVPAVKERTAAESLAVIREVRNARDES